MFILHRSIIKAMIYFSVFVFAFINLNIIHVQAKEMGQINPFTKEELLIEINLVRKEAGLPSLLPQVKLNEAAKLKGMYMNIKKYFDHWSPDKSVSPWDFLHLVGYKYQAAGENLAINYNKPKEVVEAMMASPLHRDNLLGVKYQDIGLEVYQGLFEGKNSTMVIIYFGTELTPY